MSPTQMQFMLWIDNEPKHGHRTHPDMKQEALDWQLN